MAEDKVDAHLSQISTMWSLLQQAHAGTPDAVRSAQERVLQRYSPAIYRYLLGAVRDADVAHDLFQEFALRFVRGDFHRASPARGRFRDFLKTSLYHLIIDHQRKRTLLPLPENAAEPAVEPPSLAEDEAFLANWRDELITRTFAALREHERQTGQPLYTVLRLRTDQPEMEAPQMAVQLSTRLGKAVTPEWVRNRLHSARQRFTDLLVEEVSQTLIDGTADELEQELLELGLLERCRGALERRRSSGC
jgi:RNA polymerase sigma-70 factor (ECF subfamily)